VTTGCEIHGYAWDRRDFETRLKTGKLGVDIIFDSFKEVLSKL